MQPSRVVSPRKFIVALALVSITVGVTLVIADERANRRSDREFTEAQFALRSSFGVFDIPAASQPLDELGDESTTTDGGDPTTSIPPLEAVAIVSIPKINVEVAAVTYNDYEDLRFAIGYMPESAAPNEPGITYLVGHRTGFGAPFRELDQLQPGDVISVKNAAGLIEQYQVTFVEIRTPSDALPELAQLKGRKNLLLVTCHPEFSTELRLIVGASGG
jgi:sortase A